MDCLAYSIRGMGYAMLPAIISMIGGCGIRVLWVMTIFSLPAFHSVFWLYMTYPVSWTATSATLLVCFLHVFRKLSNSGGRTSPATA